MLSKLRNSLMDAPLDYQISQRMTQLVDIYGKANVLDCYEGYGWLNKELDLHWNNLINTYPRFNIKAMADLILLGNQC